MKRLLTTTGCVLLAVTMFMACGKNKTQQVSPDEKQETAVKLPAMRLADGKVKDMDARLFNERIVNLDKGDRKYLSQVPSVIDCYATWCGPCKQLAPIMDELAAEYKGKVAFYRVDVEKEPAFTMDLGVSAMPTVFFVSAGKTTSVVGFHSKEELKKSIDALLTKQH